MNSQIKIGPSFSLELAAAGLNGKPFSWTPDGQFLFGADMNEQQRAAVLAVLNSHDPTAPAPVTVPESVTKYQCCVVLARHGLLGQTNAFFAAMASDDPRRLAWEMAATVQRDSESTLDAITHLGLSEAQANAMFIEAGQVE
ncbi:hypothetical protein [Achromobacter sp. UMC46]|uniref:hypothetical protein n=1 Tax=Achromobacter sp. UMC46 TaxID=1862319 RepID=UPI001600240F|nr:hypothetical protein [Achromobacter sp. UMC46]MBB1593605.1 hypothetical protein [Achromobacter sp. UMC46]